jgi:phage terminase small subunit
MAQLPNKAVRIAAATAVARQHGGELLLTAYDQLKPTERIFVDAYVATDNPAKAMRAAQPALAEKLINIRAVDMLNRPLVSAAIADKVRRITEKYDVSIDALVRELAYVAKSNMADYVRITPEGEPFIDLSEVSYEAMAAIKSVKVEDVKEGRGDDQREIRKVSFDLHNKLGAIDQLMRKLGAYAPTGIGTTLNVQINGGNTNLQINADMSPEQAADYYARSLEE